MSKRVSLIDPILYQSSYLKSPEVPIGLTFWKKFNVFNFLFNICLPIFIVVFVLFVLKGRYFKKIRQSSKEKAIKIKKILQKLKINE